MPLKPPIVQKYYKHTMAVLVLLGAIAGAAPTLQWIDSKVVFAADLEPISREMTRGFEAITEALTANSVNDMSTRISMLEMNLRLRTLDLYRNLDAQEGLRTQGREVPAFYLREQAALETEIGSLRAGLEASRRSQAELAKVE